MYRVTFQMGLSVRTLTVDAENAATARLRAIDVLAEEGVSTMLLGGEPSVVNVDDPTDTLSLVQGV